MQAEAAAAHPVRQARASSISSGLNRTSLSERSANSQASWQQETATRGGQHQSTHGSAHGTAIAAVACKPLNTHNRIHLLLLNTSRTFACRHAAQATNLDPPPWKNIASICICLGHWLRGSGYHTRCNRHSRTASGFGEATSVLHAAQTLHWPALAKQLKVWRFPSSFKPRCL